MENRTPVDKVVLTMREKEKKVGESLSTCRGQTSRRGTRHTQGLLRAAVGSGLAGPAARSEGFVKAGLGGYEPPVCRGGRGQVGRGRGTPGDDDPST